MGTEVNIKNNNNGKVISVAFTVIFLIVAGVCVFYYNRYKKYHAKYDLEKSRTELLSKSINALNENLNEYKIKWNDSTETSAAQINALNLQNDNLKTLYSNELEAARKMGAKNKKVNSFSQTTTVIHDSVSVPVYTDSLKSLQAVYNDKWTNIQCTIYRAHTKADISYSIKDSLMIVDFYKQHRILFGLVKWKTKQNKITVTSFNPHTSIKGFKYIKVIQ